MTAGSAIERANALCKILDETPSAAWPDPIARVMEVSDADAYFQGIEAAAHWHDEQAASHWRLAVHIQELLGAPDLADSDRREYLRCAQEQETDSWRHEQHAKAIRALAATPPTGGASVPPIERPRRPPVHEDLRSEARNAGKEPIR